MSKPKRPTPIELMLGDAAAPVEAKREFLKMLLHDPSPDANAAVTSLFTKLAANSAEQIHQQRAEELTQMLKALEDGPLRTAAFIDMLPKNGFAAPQAQVVLDDGSTACSTVPDAKVAESLRRGDRVLLDGRGKAVLYRLSSAPKTGEEAQFERRLDDRHVELTLRGHERCVFLASQDLAEKLARDEVKPGTALVVNSRLNLAYDALPPADGLAHYKYLVRDPVPDIDIARDVASPPACIFEMIEHVRVEMTRPEMGRRYNVHRCVMRLLAGVSGSGKTLAIQATIAGVYRVMSEVTGVPVNELPPRVFRLRMSEVLSYLLGQSDAQLAAFFKAVEEAASQPFVAPDGRQFILPSIAIIEECEGLLRSRAISHDGIYDRILTTALQWLDPTRPDLRDKLILYIGTTNEPDLIDRAILRRLGSSNIDRFGRLDRKGFAAVLQKHLNKVPVAADNDTPSEDIRRALVRELTTWLFSPNAALPALVELTFAGSTTAVPRHRREFLTGAFVERSVQEAARAARREELRTGEPGGVTHLLLLRAFDNQFRALAEQLSEINVRQYVDLPDGVRVATLRRVPQPSLLPQELQRA
jgi:ATP-dependent 26S proteasome regulatory subunit